jgi:hypothetical protein
VRAQRRLARGQLEHARLQQELQVDQPALALLEVEARGVAAVELGAHAPAHRHHVGANRRRDPARDQRVATQRGEGLAQVVVAGQRPARAPSACRSQVQARSCW